MFSSDWFWSQCWRVILGAILSIVLLIIYSLLQVVDIWVVTNVYTLVTAWWLRVLLLIVALWCIGRLIQWFRGWDDEVAEESEDSVG